MFSSDMFGRGSLHPSEVDRCHRCTVTMIRLGLPDAAKYYAVKLYQAARIAALV